MGKVVQLRALVVVCLVWFHPSAAGLSGAHAQERAPEARDASADRAKLDHLIDFVRQRHAREYAITEPHGIDEGRYVEIGGIPQWITIRGEDRKNPVVLFLHGGPGDATNPWSHAVFRTWLRHVTLVQWDQRGAGRTLGRNGPSIAPTITLERMTQDGVELASWLCRTLQIPKIIVVGHSFGSTLGLLMVKARPELFHAFVGTGQVADSARNYHVAYAALVDKARRLGDRRALRELEDVGPPPYADRRGYAVQRQWSNLFEGADVFLGSMLGLALTAPGYSTRDIGDWADGQNVSSERLIASISTLDRARVAGDIAVPVIVIQGREDFTTPTSLARELVQAIRAPRKAFVEIDGGHFAVFMKADAFLKELTRLALPPVQP